MAGVNGLFPLFNGSQVANILDQFNKDVDEKVLRVLQYMGELFVNKARVSGNYTDRTGNLRSSIGYIILKDGVIIDKNFQGKSKGVSQARKFASEVALEHPNGYVLIGVAGMNYAAYVEAKNFDVITGSAPEKEILSSLLKELNIDF